MVRKTIKKLLDLPFHPEIFRVYASLGRLTGQIPVSVTLERSEIESILISSPFNLLGDHVFLLPLLESLHDTWPRASIDIAVGQKLVSLFRSVPYIRNVFPCKVVDRRGQFLWRIREMDAIVDCYKKHVSECSYDLAIAPRWGSDLYSVTARYLAYLSGARRICAYSTTVDGGRSAVDRLMTSVAAGGQNEHEAVRCLRLPERLGLVPPDSTCDDVLRRPSATLEMTARPADADGVIRLINNKSESNVQDYVIISPGAGKPTHLWPMENFACVIRELHRQHGLVSLIIGGPAEKILCDSLAQVVAPVSAYSLAGKTTLAELIAIISKARLFVGNDSGPGHLAAGLSVPVVSINPFPLSGDSRHKDSAVRCRPSGPYVTVVQPQNPIPPCKQACKMRAAHCIAQISPADVLQAAESLMTHLVNSKSDEESH